MILALALSLAFASATQDIALDAYAVDVLRREEHGIVSGARITVYRMALNLARFSITFAGWSSWRLVCFST